MSKKEVKVGCGCGGCCSGIIMFVAAVFLVYSIGWGVPINGHRWNIDLFPPAVWDMNVSTESVPNVMETPIVPDMNEQDDKN